MKSYPQPSSVANGDVAPCVAFRAPWTCKVFLLLHLVLNLLKSFNLDYRFFVVSQLPPPILYSLHTMPPPSGIQFFSYGNLPNAVGPDESNFLAGRNVSLPVVHPPNPADGRNLVDSSFTNSMQNLALGLTGLFSRDIAEKINQLRDLTVKLDEAKKEIECLKQELEQIRSDKTRVEEKLEASQIGDTQACECGGDAAMKNEANTLQTQLDASRKEMKQLKWMNMAQEIELNDLKKKLANAQSKINNLLAASSSTKVVTCFPPDFIILFVSPST